MKNSTLLIALCIFTSSLFAQATLTLHDYSAVTINHDTISLSQFYGKKVMVVNTASYCGYTYQFTALENLYTNYQQYGFEIVGFPCNDFGNQDPHSDSTINTFCTGNYHTTFQMMSKVATISQDTAPVYKWLQRQDLNGVSDAHVAWNFNKFLIDEAGHWVRHYTQTTEPDDTAIVNWILNTPSVVSGIAENKADGLIEMKSSNPGSSIDFAFKNSTPQQLNINLFSSEGKLVKNIFAGTADNAQLISCDVSQLGAGIYFANVTGNGIHKTFKYVVVK